jgi:glutathionyl-hydroquinone reductase
MYGNGELIVANETGAKITSMYFEGTTNNQAMVSLGDSFILSSDKYLRKFDMNGSQIKELNYIGNYLPEMVKVDGNLFFIAGSDMEGEIKLLYGMTDANLNPINLNE